MLSRDEDAPANEEEQMLINSLIWYRILIRKYVCSCSD